MSSDPKSAEEAVDLFLERRRAGEALDPAAFAAGYPELEPDLSSALDALLALERATATDGTIDLTVPDRVGAYRVVREIGRGGMGVVLEAVEEPLGRRVALKILPAELLASPSARKRFRREAELAARLDHSGIATIYGAGVEDERPWIAMRFVEGQTLARAISTSRDEGASGLRLLPSAVKERGATHLVASLLAKVARALHSAHEQGVVHRDIKPSNIIVQPDGSPVLLDFGLAIAEDSEGRSLTRTGEAPGTPAYLAPESVSGDVARPDAQSDVYGLGVTLYECLALRRPFDAPTPAALYHAILTGAPTDLRALNGSVSRDLAVVTSTAMERDRSRRYRSALALADDLEACVAGRPIAARPVPLHGRVLRWARREPRLALAIAAAILIAFGGFLWVSMVQAAAGRTVAEKNRDLQATNLHLATAKGEAEANAREATQKADDVLSLSAIQELRDLVLQADALWPAIPDRIAAYDEWLAKAKGLIEGRSADPGRGRGRRPGLKEHEAKLSEIRLRAKPRSADQGVSEPATYEFEDPADRWWHDQLAQLVSDLKAFTDEKTGLFSEGTSELHGWGIAKRRREASTIEERSVKGSEAARRWTEAIQAIGKSEKYRGMEWPGGEGLTPQLGLLPIGPDPESGLWEFSHLATGENLEPAERGADGKLVFKEGTGIVLVLIPGGTFTMGAQGTDPAGKNYDPQALGDESPPHELTLSPFFLSKYEMTQGQWLRFTGRNPSQYTPATYHPSWNQAREEGNLLHPVEQVSWQDCTQILGRQGLVLPTEAQWEYGARAGTSTAYWSGDDAETLREVGNVADAYAKDNGGGGWSVLFAEWDDGNLCHARVGSYRANAFGLHDVHGNLVEWCRDGLGGYGLPTRGADAERVVPGAQYRAMRGGSFNDAASPARSAARNSYTPESRNNNLGVRPAAGIARE